MNEIKINFYNLEAQIEKIKALRSECDSIDVSEIDVVGSGKTIDMLQGIDKEFADLKSAMLLLLDNSADFFENVKQSVMKSDITAADEMK